MAKVVRGNFVTPLNTLGLDIDIAGMNQHAHTTIFGNDDARPSRMLKALIEHDMANGRKVIAIGFNTSYAGLATGAITVVDLTRANKGFQINPKQAGILAAMIVASPHSFAIDVGGLEPGPAARIIERIAAALSTQEILISPTTLAIDLADVATPRRRMGLDADAVQQINSLIGRAFDLGVRVLMAANAPTEYPLEFERGTMQAIVTRVTRNAVRSVGRHVDEEQRLYDNRNIDGVGLAAITQGDYWFFPMTADPYGPYLINMPDLTTAVGDRDQSKRVVTASTGKFCDDYGSAVVAAEEAAEKAEVAALVEKRLRQQRITDKVDAQAPPRAKTPGITTRKNTSPMRSAKQTRPTIKELGDIIELTGETRSICRARAVITAAALGDHPLTMLEAITAAKSEEALHAANFGEAMYNADMMMKTIATGLGYRFLTEHGKTMDDLLEFRTRLLTGDINDRIGAAGKQLRNANVRTISLDAPSRVKTLVKAWREHIADAPKADNDDVVIDVAA